MKYYLILFCGFLLLTSFLIKNKYKTFKKLYALEGTWVTNAKKGVIGETWHKVNRKYMQSQGFFINERDTITTERVALKNSKDAIYYTSTVEDQNDSKPIDFKLTSANKNVFVFENPGHDFPKRIIYDLISKDSLHAYVDAGAGITKGRVDFFYKKVKR